MPAISIQPTYPVFTGLDGLPLDAGYLWFGVANLDPQTNPTTIYWDEAMTIVAPQPVRTLAGYPSRSGTPARIFIATDYSVRVQDNKGVTVYNAAFVAVEDPNVAPFVIENDTGMLMTISMDGSDFAFNHTQAGDFLTYDNGTGDIYFAGVALGAESAAVAESVAPGGVDEASIAAGAVTEAKIGTGAVTVNKIGTGAVTTVKVLDANITAAKLSGAQTGTAPIYGARAWVNFNGTGTVAIRASGNVSSITDNGVGDYTVNFATAMPDANYSLTGACDGRAAHPTSAVSPAYTGTPSTTSINVFTGPTGGSGGSTGMYEDRAYIFVAIHR